MAARNVTRKVCSIDGCEVSVHSRGWCNRHYRIESEKPGFKKLLDRGGPLRLIKSTIENPPAECVVWPYAKSKKGYGLIHSVLGRQSMNAHRAALILSSGEPEDAELVARHKCQNKACVNPRHLEWGTVKENTADKWRDKTMYSRLSPEDVKQIRLSPDSPEFWAGRFGVCKHTVINALTYRTFSHIK